LIIKGMLLHDNQENNITYVNLKVLIQKRKCIKLKKQKQKKNGKGKGKEH
jgi:TPP-dependent indolepyruvate ferredoxin oxidoreductase alpha subunit